MTQGKGQKDKTYLQIRPAAAVVVIMLLFVVLMANALCIAGALISYYPNMIYPYDCFGWAFAPDTLGLNVNACATDDDAYPWSCMGAGMNGPLSASTSGAIAPVQIVFYLVVAIACALHLFTPLAPFQEWIAQEKWRSALFVTFPLSMLLIAAAFMVLAGLAEVGVFLAYPRDLTKGDDSTGVLGGTTCTPDMSQTYDASGNVYYNCNNYPALAVYPFDLWASIYRLSNPKNINEANDTPCAPYPLNACSNYTTMFDVQTIVNCLFGVLTVGVLAWAVAQLARYQRLRPHSPMDGWWFNTPLVEKFLLTALPSGLYCVDPEGTAVPSIIPLETHKDRAGATRRGLVCNRSMDGNLLY